MIAFRRPVAAAALLATLLAAEGCNRRGSQAPGGGAVALYVRNNAFPDVNVYSLPTVGVESRIRLGTVTGHSNAQFTVPATALRPGGVLVVYLHAIGSNTYWVSPAVMVDPTQAGCLDIYANPDGSLSRSSLYTAAAPVADDSLDGAAARARGPNAVDVRQDAAVCMW